MDGDFICRASFLGCQVTKLRCCMFGSVLSLCVYNEESCTATTDVNSFCDSDNRWKMVTLRCETFCRPPQKLGLFRQSILHRWQYYYCHEIASLCQWTTMWTSAALFVFAKFCHTIQVGIFLFVTPFRFIRIGANSFVFFHALDVGIHELCTGKGCLNGIAHCLVGRCHGWGAGGGWL